MKKVAGIAVLVMLAFLLMSVDTSASGDMAKVEDYGHMNFTPTFVVTIGIPRFDVERSELVILFGDIYGANAKLFINVPGKGWVVKEKRLPTKEDRSDDQFPKNLEMRKLAVEEDMPAWFRVLPPRLKDNIATFLAFYSGAFRVVLVDKSKDKAEELAKAINVFLNSL